MDLSRRTFVGSVLAAAALPVGLPGLARAATPSGDVVGKITVGYQGWFACAGDGAPINLANPATVRVLRLNFTANTGWLAGQCSDFGVYAT